MAALSDYGLTLAKIDLGSIDAESDHNLDEHFVKTWYATEILDQRYEHILGRKGSGKSALFRQLPQLVPENYIVHRETPVGVWKTLRRYEDQANPNRDAAFVAAWEFVLALLSAQAIVSDAPLLSERARRAFVPAHEFLKANFVDPKPQAMVKRFVRSIKSLNLSALGVGVGFEIGEEDAEDVARVVVDRVMAAIQPAIAECGLVLALDQVDEGWDGSDDSRAMMIGLLRAAKRLGDKYGFQRAGERHLRVMVFLRSDIYDSLHFDEKDKHRRLELKLHWDETTLAEMVSARLPHDVGFDDLMSSEGYRGGTKPRTYVMARTFLRPREVLQLLGEAVRVAPSDATVITGAEMIEAEKPYSAWKVQDLKQEYSKSDPALAVLLDSLKLGPHRYESVEELVALIEDKAGALLNPPGVTGRSLVEKLFDYSVIGIRINDAGRYRFKSEEPELTLPASGALFVHQSLHKGLNIIEKKSPRKASTLGEHA